MSVPLLTTVTGIFQVFGNAALTGLSVPLLTTVSGDFPHGKLKMLGGYFAEDLFSQLARRAE